MGLLEFDAEINSTGSKLEETPLMWAVKESNVDAVKVLLAHGARLDMKNEHEKTALDIAKSFLNTKTKMKKRSRRHVRNVEIIELLESQQNQILMEEIKTGCEKYLII